MGTGQSGRYLNTAGGARQVSEFALVHSAEGTFIKSFDKKNGVTMRLASGGHGEINLVLLRRYKIKYNIVKTYPNGVRIGNIPTHKKRDKRTGTGQTWFPKEWTNKTIKKAGIHVASLKRNRKCKDGETMYGTYKGVVVGVKKTNGKISTIFPTEDQKIKKGGK